MPILNNAGKTRPIAVSSLTNPVFCINSTKITVSTPVAVASKIKIGEERS